MKIHSNGHACFFLEGPEGRILTDPFIEEMPYQLLTTEADIVTVSHDHDDHNASHRVQGNPSVVDGVGDFIIDGVPICGIASHHDDVEGEKRGHNIIYAFTLDGIRVAHLGDLGTPLTDEQQAALLDVEVALVPVGGFYTIDAIQAAELVRKLPNLRVVIPMHYKTERTKDFPIATVEPFLEMMDNARHIGSPQIELSKKDLPEALEVWILDYA